MIGLFCFVLAVLVSPFKSTLRLEAENAVLRHQLIVLKRRLHGRVRLGQSPKRGEREPNIGARRDNLLATISETYLNGLGF